MCTILIHFSACSEFYVKKQSQTQTQESYGTKIELFVEKYSGSAYVTSVVTTTELIIEAGDQEDVSKHLKWTWVEVHVSDQCAVHHTRVKLSLLMLCSDATVITMPQKNWYNKQGGADTLDLFLMSITDVCLLKGKRNILAEKGNMAYSFETSSNKSLVKATGFFIPMFSLVLY